MISSIRDKRLVEIIEGRVQKRLSLELVKAVRRTLNAILRADRLDDLRHPPGNRLEALRGDRTGQHSIRVNDQWRICFRWEADGAHDVELVDYH